MDEEISALVERKYEVQDRHLVFFKDTTGDSVISLILTELLENGQVWKEDDRVIVPYEELYKLPSADQKILGLPASYPFEIKVLADGMLHEPTFKIEAKFYEYDHGRELAGKRIGGFFILADGTEYFLSHEQYKLCEAIDEFNSLDHKDFPENLTRFAEIKQLSEESAAILDSYLTNEYVFIPNKISIKLKPNKDDSVELLPELPDADEYLQEQFEIKFDRFASVRQAYVVKDRQNRKVRIPFNDKQREELKKFKKYKRVKGEEKEKIISSPQEIFDPEVIDLDNFSDRVIEIGLYKPRYFPFISPYQSEWIPGIVIDSGKEKEKILIRDDSELRKLEDAYNEAQAANKGTVEFDNKSIPIEEAKNLIDLSKQQASNPSEPVKSIRDKRVLIIEDNLFEDKYQRYKKQEVPQQDTLIHKFENPPHLKSTVELYHHQKEGIAWLESLCREAYPGGLLADDMGLGKTIQILSFISWHDINYNKNHNPYLIVAPVTLLENWRSEIERFFNMDIDVHIIHGYSSSELSLSFLRRHAIFITNYETVRRYQLIFGQVDWSVVVVDEAQKIKTPGTLVTNSIKALKADFRIAATGTPVENSMVDIWCIVDFIAPGLLGSAKEFYEEFQKVINKDISDEELNRLGKKLRSRIGLYFKRRLKEDILSDLPNKVYKKLPYMMPEYQRSVYIGTFRDRDDEVVLSTIIKLKKVSDHPYLIGFNYRYMPTDRLIQTSAKLKATIDILKEIQQRGEKAIIFAEFKETQKILQRVVQDYFKLERVSIINGDTASTPRGKRSQKETRQQAIDRFQGKEGFNVIIMSPIAGGVGLNITGANHVIHYSRHWNPAKESQATDRVYRIGQKKDVFIYYPMAVLDDVKTFDVIIDELLQRKRNLSDAAMFPSAISEISKDEFIEKLRLDLPHIDRDKDEYLSLEDLDNLEPAMFEAVIALIYKKRGYSVILTPKTNDKGADVIAFSTNDDNYLIQVKHSRSLISHTAIGEVLKANGYYENLYKKSFSTIVATNRYLNENANMLAQDNNVMIFDRTDLERFLKDHRISLSELLAMESTRQEKI